MTISRLNKFNLIYFWSTPNNKPDLFGLGTAQSCVIGQLQTLSMS